MSTETNSVGTDPQPMTAKEAKAKAKAAKAEAKALRPWYKKPLILTGIGGVAIVGLIAVSSGGSDDAAPATDTVAAAEADGTAGEAGANTEAETTATDVAAIGDAVRDGNFEFVVEGVETGSTNVGGEWGENAQGEYTIVTMTVTNIGDEPQYFSDSDQTGTDSQGREISADTTAGIYANEDGQGFLEEINPGNAVNVRVVYDLPAGETLTTVTLHDSAFSGGVDVTLG